MNGVRQALILASVTFYCSRAQAQTLDDPVESTARAAWKAQVDSQSGIDTLGVFVRFGAGTWGLHYSGVCPRYHIVEKGKPDVEGCVGNEPVRYVVHNDPFAFQGAFGYRFSRYLALETPIALYFGRANSAQHQSTLEAGADLNALFDVGIGMHGDIPITQSVGLFATVGVQWKIPFADINQPIAGTQVCVHNGPPPNPNAPIGPFNQPTCDQYQYHSANSGFLSVTRYYPVSVGVEWFPYQHLGYQLSYQPPTGRNFAISQIMLSVVTNAL